MRTEHLTDRSRLVFRLAEKRARQLGSATVEPEHVLLGLISEEAGIGGVALRRLGATHEQFLAVLPTGVGPEWYLAQLGGVILAGALLFLFALRVFGRLEGNFAGEL